MADNLEPLYRSVVVRDILIMVQSSIEGWLEKKSRHLKNWRRRYALLCKTTLYTYESSKCCDNPTETIDVNQYSIITKADNSPDRNNDYRFIVSTPDTTNNRSMKPFVFKAVTDNDRNRWISIFEKQILENKAYSLRQKAIDTNSIKKWEQSKTYFKKLIALDHSYAQIFKNEFEHTTFDDARSEFTELEEKEPSLSRHKRVNNPIENYSIQKQTVSIKDFRILQPLGRGAFGPVNICEKRDCRKLYAMKRMDKRHIQATDSIATILRERDYLSRMQSRFVTTLKYAIMDRHSLYLIMDLMLGSDLKYHLNRVKRFSEERTRFHAAEVLLGLEHLHSQNIIYRDLKLENILMDETGHCRISDLGLAIQIDNDKNRIVSGYIGEATHCIAPESLLSLQSQYDFVCDYFCFGVLIYRCICGKRPFKNKVIEKEPDFSYQYMTPSACSLLKGLMCKNPKIRLGANDTDEIKMNPWFDNIDWEQLKQGYLEPPFIPNLKELRKVKAAPKNMEHCKVKLTEEFETEMERFIFTSPTVIEEERGSNGTCLIRE